MGVWGWSRISSASTVTETRTRTSPPRSLLPHTHLHQNQSPTKLALPATCRLAEPSCKDSGVFHKAFATGFTKSLCGKRCETNRNGGRQPPQWPCTLLFLFTCSPQPVLLSRSSSCPRPWQGQLLASGCCCSGNQKEKVNNKDKSFDYGATEFARHREGWGEINVTKPEFPGSTGFPLNRIHTSLPTSANNSGSCQGTEESKGKKHQ